MQKIITKENDILNSLQGLERAAAPNFFYTRLIGKMQGITEDKKALPFIIRPALMVAVLTTILLVNLISLSQLNNKPNTIQIQNNKLGIDAFTNAFSMNNQEIY
jgi:hypothetical protein